MTIQEMFVKSITRDVKGVIKVGQGEDANVKQELEEYVVTRELQKHIARFFEAYKKGIAGNTDKMGVWISGFFGSGKSHFLKILSYLLENKEVDGKRAIDYFEADHKIDNGMVLADMKLAADTSTDVILFNIDSKSEMAGKQNKDELGLEHMDYMISTHPHEDHIGGLPAVLNAVPVDLILSPVTAWEGRRFSSLLEYADLQGAPVSVPAVGDTLQLGGAVVTILQCWPESVQWRENDVNDMSIVVRIDYGETSIIVTGDAEEASEYMMIDSGMPLKADVLRIAHHGSTYSTSEEFLKAVSPRYAVISCGEGNAYFHPHGRVLNLLEKNNIWLFRTDLQGTVKCVSDGKEMKFSVDRWASKEKLYAAPGWTQVEGED